MLFRLRNQLCPAVLDRSLNHLEKDALRERLFQEIESTRTEGRYSDRDIGMAGKNDERQSNMRLSRSPQELETRHLRHDHVGDDAARTGMRKLLKKTRWLTKAFGLKVDQRDLRFKQPTHPIVIIDDEDTFGHPAHTTALRPLTAVTTAIRKTHLFQLSVLPPAYCELA